MTAVEELAGTLALGTLLERLTERYGEYELVAHWKQGEFHHDVVVRLVGEPRDLPGRVLVVATNCNGGVKEVSVFAETPQREALWRERCPASEEFGGELPPLLARARTHHWFDPCELLGEGARSELRQKGGGWEPVSG